MPDETIIHDLFDFPAPAENNIVKKLSLWATHYYVHKVKATDNGEPLLDMSGKELGPKIPARDWCLAAVEGTIGVEDKDGQIKTYNYAGTGNKIQVDCSKVVPNLPATGKVRWRVSNGPYGDGVKDMILVPFRSIAVDKKQTPISYKSVIYIPAARGVKITLPSGTVVEHDGYFYAADTGGAIKNTHIDVFGGISAKNPFPNFIKSSATKTFEAILIENNEISKVLEKLHTR